MHEVWDSWVRFWMDNSRWNYLASWGVVLVAAVLLTLLKPLLEQHRGRRDRGLPHEGEQVDIPPWKRRAVCWVLTVSAASRMLFQVIGFYLLGITTLFALGLLAWMGEASGWFTGAPMQILGTLVIQGLLLWFAMWVVRIISVAIVDDSDFQDLRTRINGTPLIFTDEPDIPASVGGVFLILLVIFSVLDYILKGRAEVLPGILYTFVILGGIVIARLLLRRRAIAR